MISVFLLIQSSLLFTFAIENDHESFVFSADWTPQSENAARSKLLAAVMPVEFHLQRVCIDNNDECEQFLCDRDMIACVDANIAMAQTRRLVFARQWINLPMFEPANSMTSGRMCYFNPASERLCRHRDDLQRCAVDLATALCRLHPVDSVTNQCKDLRFDDSISKLPCKNGWHPEFPCGVFQFCHNFSTTAIDSIRALPLVRKRDTQWRISSIRWNANATLMALMRRFGNEAEELIDRAKPLIEWTIMAPPIAGTMCLSKKASLTRAQRIAAESKMAELRFKDSPLEMDMDGLGCFNYVVFELGAVQPAIVVFGSNSNSAPAIAFDGDRESCRTNMWAMREVYDRAGLSKFGDVTLSWARLLVRPTCD